MLSVMREPQEMGPWENCCFCRQPTPFWYFPEWKSRGEVSCCESCAAEAIPEDVPTKKDWVRRERIAEKVQKVVRTPPKTGITRELISEMERLRTAVADREFRVDKLPEDIEAFLQVWCVHAKSLIQLAKFVTDQA